MPRTIPDLPDGLRIYAVGDVHGRFDLLKELAGMIGRDLAASPPERAVEIFLGDYIDRGPQSREAVDWLIDTPPLTNERICLLGNHEDLLLQALADSASLANWIMNGGDTTLASYGVTHLPESLEAMRQACIDAVPAEHRAFFQSLPRTAEFGSYLFVHAGIDPDRPLNDQDPFDLIWIRGRFHKSDRDFGRIVVHGHTPVQEPDIRPNRINIDTGAVFSGLLTCLVLEGGEQRLLQTAR